MPDSILADLPAATALDGSELFYAVQAGVDVKATGLQIAAQVQPGSRIALTGDTTYYVATTGNDTTGTGAVGAPWATVQKAYDVISTTLDFAGFNVTIQLADGTYAKAGRALDCVDPWVGGGSLTIQGNLGDRTAVKLQRSTDGINIAASIAIPTTLKLQFMQSIATDTSFSANISHVGTGSLTLESVDTGGGAIAIYSGNEGAVINVSGDYSLLSSGTGISHVESADGGVIFYFPNTIAAVGTINHTNGFATIDGPLGFIEGGFFTTSGTFTGKRFTLYGGVLLQYTIDRTDFPGDAEGVVYDGEVFVDHRHGYDTQSNLSQIKDKGTVNSGTVTFDRADGAYQKLTVGGALAVAFSNWGTGIHSYFILQIVNGGSNVTWPTINWVKPDGSTTTTFADTGSLQVAGTNFIRVWSSDAGATVYGRALFKIALADITGLGANVATFLATPSSANLISAVTDETGTGALVFADTPTLITPVLGTPTSGTLTNCTGLPAAGGGTGQSTYAKGDILVSPGSNTLNKLAVSITDGQVLTVDAASTNGVKWAAVPGGGLTIGTTTITGGTTTRFLYDLAGVVQESVGYTWDSTNQAATIASIGNPAVSTLLLTGGTALTTSQPVLNMTQTWNAGAVTFTALKLDVTSTASASGSLLLDLKVGGSTKFSVDKAGSIISAGGANYLISDGSGFIYLTRTALQFQIAGSVNYQGSDSCLTFSGTGGVIQQGKADAAAPVGQTLQVQSVVAGTSNTAGVDWTFVGSKGTGTGAGGAIIFKTAPASTTGTSQNAAAEALRIASTGAVTITERVGASALTLTGATQTTSNPVLNLTQTWNNSGVAFNGIKLNVTDTSSLESGVGGSLLLNLQVGGALRFCVAKEGVVGIAGASTKSPRIVIGLSTDTFFRVQFGLDANDSPFFKFGPGGAGAYDCFLRRAAAADFQFGDADAAAPVSQTTRVQSVVAGTSDTAGVDWTLTGSKGTGTGAGGAIIFKTAPAGTTGTSQNAAAEQLRISAAGVNTSARIIENETNLADGANVALDASLGNTFKLVAAGDRSISVPTNKPASGKVQKIVIMHTASAADRTLTLTTGSAGAFRFGTDIAALSATTSGKTDYIGCIYSDADDRWDVVSYVKGF